ncbi:transcriptional regulator [Alteromonadales bacterium alter-6D02]|nr:transcriptional regulator [Alteromonadales bacterium alter-6D02]
MLLDPTTCHKARLSRDPRFDGRFFTAVKTTGIYCRSICPASPPKECNVTYYASATEAANAGFRPCLRCRPDSAPDSPAWQGVNTTLNRAIRLINQGALQQNSLPELALRLGIGDRYLRQLFKQHLGMSPKAYALYQQCLFAKQLLHQSSLSITDIALASGFNSVRRFNDCFKAQLALTPSQVRKSTQQTTSTIELIVPYRPPYHWPLLRDLLSSRAINGLEWCNENSYGRSFSWLESTGKFTAFHQNGNHSFRLEIELDELSQLQPIIYNIKRLLDLDADTQAIEHDLGSVINNAFELKQGLRLPGIWNMFEAGIRAILGQQISVTAARNLVTTLVHELGTPQGDKIVFPTPQAIADNELVFLRIPSSRKQTLRNLAQHYLDSNEPDEPQAWLKLKGIGPWTVDYAKMRGLSDPDVYLGGDLGVKKAVAQTEKTFDPQLASPWQSYLTFQLWSQL